MKNTYFSISIALLEISAVKEGVSNRNTFLHFIPQRVAFINDRLADWRCSVFKAGPHTLYFCCVDDLHFVKVLNWFVK